MTRFEQSGHCIDLILLYQEALDLRVAPHLDQSACLTSLVSALATRFEQSAQRQDLDERISLYREMLELRLNSHLNHSGCLIKFASALKKQFEQSGQYHIGRILNRFTSDINTVDDALQNSA